MNRQFLNLSEIPRVKNITPKNFKTNFFQPQKPVVLENFIEDWPAYHKWTLDYIKKVAGAKTVPLYDNRPVSAEEGFNQAHANMKMADYIDLLQTKPTNYRIFLWNILKEVPQLQEDFTYPDLGIRLLKKVPMLFFGGQNAYTFMHYDIDLANIFHFHFDGKKEVILFDQRQNPYLYKVPFSLITREDINFSEPDLEKWPALKKAQGYQATLGHGDVLYMPEGYWHHMRYITPGFSMSLRAVPRKPKNFMKALYNVFIMRNIDNLMRKLRGQKWIDYKNRTAL